MSMLMLLLMAMQFSIHVWARAHFFLVRIRFISTHLSSFGCKRQDIAKVLFLCTLALQFRNWNLYSDTQIHSHSRTHSLSLSQTVKVISYMQVNPNKFYAFNLFFRCPGWSRSWVRPRAMVLNYYSGSPMDSKQIHTSHGHWKITECVLCVCVLKQFGQWNWHRKSWRCQEK